MSSPYSLLELLISVLMIPLVYTSTILITESFYSVSESGSCSSGLQIISMNKLKDIKCIPFFV